MLQPASHLLSTLSAAAGAKGVQVKEVESSSAADKAGELSPLFLNELHLGCLKTIEVSVLDRL